ncbi:hypothetical protein [Bacillus wiedmannii]|uniref:hypothetical protein n=1 Tax=Bacillus wiedmannii TaxID=1890302 RepID=UPI000BF1A536|nr:hypothetical protein [Bacillus wiedmannii]PEO39960.1 hypothetical protein CN555_06360 [Bacillus wiedmannii]
MKRRLAEMQGMKKAKLEAASKVKPATVKQIETIKKVWMTKFGEELELSEDITESEVQELFHKVNSHARYGQWR